MSDAFRRVAGGFRLALIGLVIFVLAIVGGSIANGAIGAVQQANRPLGAPPQINQQPQGAQLVVVGVAGVLAAIGGVLTLLGGLRCTAVPEDVPGAKGKITTSVALAAVTLVVGVAVNLDQAVFRLVPMMATGIVQLVASLLNVIAAILFLQFTARVAEFIGRPEHAKSARTILILYAVMIVLGVMLMGVLIGLLFSMGFDPANPNAVPPQVGQPGGPPPNPAMIGLSFAFCGVGCPFLVVMIVAVILYALLLARMAKACDEFADDPAGRPADDRDYDDRDDRDYDDRDRWDDDRRGR